MAGYQLGENVADVEKMLGPVSNAVLAVLLGGYLWRLWRHRPDKTDAD